MVNFGFNPTHNRVLGHKAVLVILRLSIKIAFESKWYAIIVYWLPLRERIGKRPMSFV